MLYHIDYIYKVSFQNVLFQVLEAAGVVTLITFVGFLSNICSFMYLEMTMTYKAFTMLKAFRVFPSSLNSFMLLKTTMICEGIITLSIFIRFLSSMVSFMPSMSSITLTMFFNNLVFPIVAYRNEVPVRLKPHIFGKSLLRWIPQVKLFLMRYTCTSSQVSASFNK